MQENIRDYIFVINKHNCSRESHVNVSEKRLADDQMITRRTNLRLRRHDEPRFNLIFDSETSIYTYQYDFKFNRVPRKNYEEKEAIYVLQK